MKIELPQTYCGRFTLRAPHNIVSGCEILKCIGLEGTAVLVLGRQYSPWRSNLYCPLAISTLEAFKDHPQYWHRRHCYNPLPLMTTTVAALGTIYVPFAWPSISHHRLPCQRLHCLRPRLITPISGMLIYVRRRSPTAFICFSSHALRRTPSEQ
jgi:hypothetical protein